MLKNLWQKAVNFFCKNGVFIGESDTVKVYKKVNNDGSVIIRTFDKVTKQLVKMIEQGLETVGSIRNNNKFYQTINKQTKVTDLKTGRIINILTSDINTNPTSPVFSSTLETKRQQKTVTDLAGKLVSETEVRVFGKGDVVAVYDKSANNIGKVREYRQGKLQYKDMPFNTSKIDICSSLKI